CITITTRSLPATRAFSSTGIGICSEHFLPATPCLSIFPTTCTPNADPIVQSEDPLTLNTIFLDSSITQDINPLSQTLPESQPLPLTQIQPQVHIQYPLPVLPFSPIPQIRVCGVYFQNESDRLTSSEIQQLEWNVLQKQHESLWGLPTVVQRSQEEFCSSAPNSPYCPPSKAHLHNESVKSKFNGVWTECKSFLSLSPGLEVHITKFHLRRMWGLPTKVLEPRENIKLKYTSSHSLLDSKSSSSINLT
ncbi:spermatogenesis-associated protein 31D3-like, partial [Eptesicus fuscus]|uniref:spermatogenesis-associated protein 31D3-like n=1 Tax=Eptesicus fuscus TaxID=29078 RepID=UPI0024046796